MEEEGEEDTAANDVSVDAAAASSELRTVFHINDDSGGFFFLGGKCGLASRGTGCCGRRLG